MNRNFITVLLSLCMFAATVHAQHDLASILLSGGNSDACAETSLPGSFLPDNQNPKLMSVKPDAMLGEQCAVRLQDGTWMRGDAKKPAAKSLNIAELVGDYAEFDYTLKDSTKTARTMVGISLLGTDSVLVSNLYGLADTLKAIYNGTNGTLSIAPGLIYTHATYGQVWACPIDAQTGEYSTTQPITATLNADGSLTLSPWAVVVVQGSYKGGSFGVFSKSELLPANASVTEVLNHSGNDSTVVYPAYIEQTAKNEISIMNFAGNGAVVSARLNPDRTLEIAPQRIFTNNSYGAFFCYAADWSVNKLYVKAIEGIGTDTGFTLGNWGVSSHNNKSLLARRVIKTVFSFASGVVTYPDKTVINWIGNGTEASPYIISTAQQLQDFAEDVHAGNTYEGKHIALEADIDLGTLPMSFRPIGTSSVKPFRGTFDGRGYALKNLSLSMGEENNFGLFGYADSLSTLRNITISGFNIIAYGSNTGLLAGYSNGIVTNVKVVSSILTAGGLYAGGVVGGYDGALMSNVDFNGTVSGVGATGGVAGMLKGNMSHSQSHGTVKLSSLMSDYYSGVGGLVGMTLPKGKQRAGIKYCYNDATITDAQGSGYTGGLVGSLQTGTLECSYNMGYISSRAISYSGTTTLAQGTVGGVAGTVYGGNIYNCYAANVIVNSRESERVGGLVGNVIVPIIQQNSKDDTVILLFPSSIRNCYVSGQTKLPQVYAAQGLYGRTYSDSIFVDCYYDRQIAGSDSPKRCAKETSFFTSGDAINGLSADTWVYTKGLYPRLKGIEETSVALLSASPLTLGAGQSVLKVKSNFQISTANGVTWKLYNSTDNTFVAETAGLAVSGDSVKLKNTNSSEILVAFSPEMTQYKMYCIETVNPSGFLGSGTAEDPYLIQDKEDLMALDRGVTLNGQDYKGDFFKQTNDIDIEYATDFNGIGNANNSKIAFGGTYDGQCYAIHNMRLGTITTDANNKPVSKGSSQNIGLFGYTTSDAVIKNVVIASDCEVLGYSNAGSLVGHSCGKIEGCRNYGKVTTTGNYAGGITGYLEATGSVSGCYNSGTVSACGTYAAGIAAYVKGNVTYCQNDGVVRADSVTQYATSANPNYAGGITGFLSAASTIGNNINAGSVYARTYVGGITTMLASNGTLFENNLNYGTVTYTNYSSSDHGALVARAASAKSEVSNNYFDGQIVSIGAAASAPSKGMYGVLTKILTSGEPIEGMSAEKYDYEAGKYPVLKAFADEAAAKAHRRMIVTFADNDKADDMTAAASLKTAGDSLVWMLKNASEFALKGNSISVNTGSATSSVRDTLVATDGVYTKIIALRAMPTLFEGSGTKSDPYQIKTPADMAKLASVTNDDRFAFSGRFFKVMNDIDFTDAAYAPVATGEAAFDADFDGNGKKFSNLTYAAEDKEAVYFGMFGSIGRQGSIHDLTLESGTITGYGYTSGFAGTVYGSIRNCENKASVKTTKSPGAAGIAITLAYGATIADCCNRGTIASAGTGSVGVVYETESGSVVENCTNVADIAVAGKINNAGIVSSNGGTLRNCVNKGNISGSGTLGGVAAKSVGGDSIICCVNEGNITGTSSTVGGIVASKAASAVPTVISDCHNTGVVSGAGKVGGLTGTVAPGVILANCYNTADVTGTSDNVGGLIGNCTSNTDKTLVTKATGCYNAGKVTGKKTTVGGIIGDMAETEAVFTDCYNVGEVSGAGNYAGGFAAKWYGTAYRCYNIGAVDCGGYGAGGFSGISSGEIHECFNAGDVTSRGASSAALANAGGLWGYGLPRIYDSYNMGTVTAAGIAGGINGRAYGGAVVRNVYNAGRVVVADSTIVSNITALYKDEMELENTFYDAWMNPGIASATDGRATALTTRALALAAISDSTFCVTLGMYPTLKCFADNEVANWYAAIPVLAEGDSTDCVRGEFVVGTPSGTIWTSSENISINNGVATPLSTGEAWVRKTCGKLEKTYSLNIVKATGINETNAPAQIIRTEYITLGGVSLGAKLPSGKGVYVVKNTYADGTCSFSKITATDR